MKINIGVDVGGTKILASALGADGEILQSKRVPTPKHDYTSTIQAIASIVNDIESQLNIKAPVGLGIPGSVSPSTGLIQNANSTWLNGKNLEYDISRALNRNIRLENDANCFAISEAADGAAKDVSSVFGVILGTGVGAGLIFDQKTVNGPLSVGGEWGHCSLPFPNERELATALPCWCGQKGCIESWISGPAMLAHHNSYFSENLETTEEIVEQAQRGDEKALQSLNDHCERTARSLSMVVNIFDPEVIVLGGGLSELDHLYRDLPDNMSRYIFSKTPNVNIRRPRFGATSGVRGAARLWPF